MVRMFLKRFHVVLLCVTIDGDGVVGHGCRFVRRCLLPIVQPFDGVNLRSIVVLDNATIHHCKLVVNLISAAGSLVFYLPPYSPDLMPIEELFSKVKSYIRDSEKAYQSIHSPELIVAHAFASITQQDCIGYMTHAGYIRAKLMQQSQSVNNLSRCTCVCIQQFTYYLDCSFVQG